MRHSASSNHITLAAVQELQNTDPETLSSWILDQEHLKAPDARGSLTQLLTAIAVGCKFVASAVRKAGLAGMLGMAGSENVQGEDQKKLDVLANDVFINLLTKSKQCAVLVSEENEHPIAIDADLSGEYIVCFDPLDGSSNIDCAVSVGTIFGIHHARPGSGQAGDETLQTGRSMVASGYCLYGSSCCLVLTLGIGQDVSCFTLDPSLGEFILTHPKVKCPPRGNIYSANEGNYQLWDNSVREYVQNCKYPKEGPPKSLRYVGSMVADVHRTLLYGGSFLYPADSKSKNGKLRLLYEANPMAMLVENAGGLAVSGSIPILDLKPEEIHQRCPVYLGSRADVLEILTFHRATSA